MSIYESSKTNTKKQLEFYKDLSEQLERENKQLKKQLEEYKKWYQDELEENSKLSELWCDSRAKIRKFENQQKEFIKWLEDYLNLFDYRDIQEQAGYDMLEEILQKYKETMGDNK